MKRLFLISVLMLIACSAFARGGRKDPPRHILEQAYSKVDKSVIKTGGECFNYPKYSDRKAWDALFGPHKKTAIKQGEKYLKYEWKYIKVTDYLELERSGSRKAMEDPNKDNLYALSSLIFAELAEGKGRFIDQIINGVWLQTERTSWILSAHQPRQKTKRALPDARDIFVDLGTHMMSINIAVALHFFESEFDKADPSIAVAVREAMNRNVFEPYLDVKKESEQTWLGFNIPESYSPNNWNPWCNSMVLYCFLLVEKDRDRLLKAFERAVLSTDIYMDTNKMDGGCDEGPGYWGRAAASLYDFIRIANDATDGQFGCWDDVQFRAMSTYKSRVFFGDGWCANFGDGSARAAGGGGDIIYRYGKDCGYKEISDFAIYLNSFYSRFGQFPISKFVDAYRDLELLRYEKQFSKEAKEALDAANGDVEQMRRNLRKELPAVTWYDETQHLIAHNNSGWYFAAKGGHNGESHNHNDVGTSILFVDDIPVIIDAGVDTYTKQTFSPDRYKIWSMQSGWHNLPSINGCDQHVGVAYKASSVSLDEKKKIFTVDIAGAYTEEAACNSWKRTYQLTEKSLLITDRYDLKQRIAPDVVNFLVQGSVYLPGESVEGYKVKKGEVIILANSFDKKRSALFSLSYPSSTTPSVEETKVGSKLAQTWGETLRRIRFSSSEKATLTGNYSFSITKK